jgi:hypothetical protein
MSKFHQNTPSGSQAVPCGRADGHDAANSRFSQFCERALNGQTTKSDKGQILRTSQVPHRPPLPTEAGGRVSIVGIASRYGLGLKTRPWGEGGGEMFPTSPDRHPGPSNLLYNRHRVFFQGAKRPRRGANHPPRSSAKAKGKVELYIYLPSELSWLVLGRILPF